MRNEKGFLTDCCYVGIEAEGPFEGTLTLFIATYEITMDRIETFLAKHPEIKNVYFGAGGVYGMSDSCKEDLRLGLTEMEHIVLEVNSFDQLKGLEKAEGKEHFHIVYTIKENPPLFMFDLMIKFECEKEAAIASPSDGWWLTPFSDIRYSLDQVVEL